MNIKPKAMGNLRHAPQCDRGRSPLPPLAIILLLLALILSACGNRNETFNSLTQLAGAKTDKGIAGHYYTEIYDLFFLPLKHSAIKVLEIGVGRGGSLEMWRDYFKQATIYGIDIVPTPWIDSKRVKTFVADQADRTQLRSFIAAHGGHFDLIVDDGGHSMSQQQISLGFFFKYLKPGGYYVIEDLHTSLRLFWGGYEVNEDGSNSTLTILSRFIQGNPIQSPYLSPAENRYLSRHIEFCLLFMRSWPSGGSPSIMGILKKRTHRAV